MSRVGLLATALWLLGAAPASAAPAWLAPGNLSAPGRDATNPVVAMDAAGDTIAAWERQSTTGPGHVVQLSTRSAGSSFTSPVTLSEAATSPEVAMTPAGEAVVAWWHFVNDIDPEKAHSSLEISTRPAGGSAFSAPSEVVALPPEVIPGEAKLAMNAAGDVVLAWPSRDPESAVDPSAPFIEASVRPAGGSFSTPDVVSPEPIVKDQSAFIGGVAIDGAGEATVVWDYQGEENAVVEAASRPAGGPFSPPVPVNPALAAGEDAVSPEVGSDAAGDVTVVWRLATATTDTIESADRAGAGFSAPNQLSEDGTASFAPQIAVSSAGAATVIWELSEGGDAVIQGAARPDPMSEFSSPADVSAEAGQAMAPKLASNGSGEAVVAWSGFDGLGQVVLASIGKPGGGFSAPAEVSATSPSIMRPAVTIDAAGDATVLWPRSNGTNSIIQFAGYDAFVPELRGLSIPSSGTVGTPVQLSVSPFDAWPMGAATFAFGDGTEALGNAVTHTYSAPGAYLVGVTAQDAAGTAATAAQTIAIAPRNDFSIGKLKLNRKKGTGTLTIAVPGPGRLVLSGRGLTKATKRSGGAGAVALPIAPRGKARKRLGQKGKLTTQLSIAFTPDGGVTAVKTKRVTLVEKRG